MKSTAHLKSLFKFWESSISRRMSLYFVIFGAIIFYATSSLYLMAMSKNFVAATSSLIQLRLRNMMLGDQGDVIWRSLNQYRPEFVNFLRELRTASSDFHSISDISVYCKNINQLEWYQIFHDKQGILHAEPVDDPFLERLDRSLKKSLIQSKFRFFFTEEKLTLFFNMTDRKDVNLYFIKVEADRQGIIGLFREFGTRFGIFFLVILFLSRAVGYFFARRFARPIEKLTEGVAAVANGDLTTKISISSNDEIGTLAAGFNQMTEGLVERDIIKETFGKYVTKEVRDEILEGKIPLNGELKIVTILFADLRNFTQMAETISPREVAIIINGYFKEMTDAIRVNKGLVIQFIGDEIEAVFGAPLQLHGHPDCAVRSALEMRRRLEKYNSELISQGYSSLDHGIGIHTGQVLAANIGSPDRLSYTLIGDTVNLTSRIQGLNKELGTDILISAATKAELKGIYSLEKEPSKMVKGKKDPIDVFKVC